MAANPLRIATPVHRQPDPAEGLRDVRDTLPRPPGDAAAPLLVDIRTAAKLLAVSERSLWAMTDRGEVRCVRLGRAKRYAVSDLQEFVDRLRGKGVME